MVDARQQPTLAPFLAVGFRREAPAHRKAFCLKRGQRGREFARRQTEASCKFIWHDWAESFQPAAHDLDKGVWRDQAGLS